MALDRVQRREAAEALRSGCAETGAAVRITVGCLLARRDLIALAPRLETEGEVQRLEDRQRLRHIEVADQLVVDDRAVVEAVRSSRRRSELAECSVWNATLLRP